MITDKEKELIQFVFDKLPIRIESTDTRNLEIEQYGIALITELVKDIKNKSADQARKEAAERAVAFIRTLNSESMDLWSEYEDDGLRDAILGDSVVKENLITDQISDAGKGREITAKMLRNIATIVERSASVSGSISQNRKTRAELLSYSDSQEIAYREFRILIKAWAKK